MGHAALAPAVVIDQAYAQELAAPWRHAIDRPSQIVVDLRVRQSFLMVANYLQHDRLVLVDLRLESLEGFV